MHAAEDGLDRPATMLLQAGADPNIRTKEGATALRIARDNLRSAKNYKIEGYKTIIELLIDAGAQE